MTIRFNEFPFFKSETIAPPTASSSQSGELSHEETIEFLGDEEEKEKIELPPKKEKEEPDKEKEDEEELEKEEEDELKEIEEELEEPTEEQLELITPVRRREILSKYPQLFKDFPYLEKAYYREQQFTEVFPTIDDAKNAAGKAETLDRFENDVVSGNTETILKAVKETNPNGFHKIVDSYLPTLAKVDEQAYYHVLGNITKHTIMAMVQEARRSSNDALQNAALLLNQFVFGTSDFHPPTNLSKTQAQPDSREQQIQEREQQFVKSQFENTRGDLNTRVNNVLRNTIDANIDPKSSMSDYVRKNASRDAFDSLETLIDQDSRFKSLVDKLWEKAFEDGFTKVSVDRIRSAYVSKAKTLLPSVIKKARIEALRGMGKRVSSEDDQDSEKNRGPVSIGRPRSQESKSGKIKSAKDIPANMRTLDFLMQD